MEKLENDIEFYSSDVENIGYVDINGKQNEYATYAYSISQKDKDFVLLLNAENQKWNYKEKHKKGYKLCWTWDHWKIGKLPNQLSCNAFSSNEKFYRTHYDYGFCGMSDGYKKHITDDPRFLTDWRWQIDQCYKEYKAGTRFYGWEQRHERGKFVKFNDI